MKNITTLALLIFSFTFSFATDTTIIFREISHSKVFDLAAKEEKPVFMYFHFDGCGACKKMEKTAFIDQAVIDLYNENFISFEVNTQKGEGIEINKSYNVRMHPTFLFMDKEGNMLHKAVGVFSPEDFIAHAKQAMNSGKSLFAKNDSYKSGNRDPEFMFDYCLALRDAYELDSLVINEYLSTQTDLDNERNIRFIYEFAVHQHKITMPLGSRAFQYLLNNREAFSNYFDSDQVNTRIMWILLDATYKAVEKQDEASFIEATKILSDFDNGSTYFFKEMDGRTTGAITGKNLVLSARIAFYEKTGDTAKHKQFLGEYIDLIWDDANELNSKAWNYYERYNDVEKLNLAKDWAIRSIELKEGYNNVDTYASILYKLGEYKEALKQAELAISLAKESGANYSATADLVKTIKKKMDE